MGLLSSSSRSSDDNRREVGTGGGFAPAAGDDIGLNNATITMLDGGAIGDAMQLADRTTNRAIQSVERTGQTNASLLYGLFEGIKEMIGTTQAQNFSTVEKMGRQAETAAERSQKLAAQVAKSDTENLLQFGMVALVVTGAVYLMRGKKK